MTDKPIEQAPIKRGRGRPRKPKPPPSPPKKRGRKPREHSPDYEAEYLAYKRCRTCKRKTEGEEDFKSTKLKRLARTCTKCRASVLKSLKKTTQWGDTGQCPKKNMLAAYKLLVDTLCSEEDIQQLASEHPEHARAWEALFNINLDD